MDVNTSKLTAFFLKRTFLYGEHVFMNVRILVCLCSDRGAIQNGGNSCNCCHFGRVKEDKNQQIWAFQKFNVKT